MTSTINDLAARVTRDILVELGHVAASATSMAQALEEERGRAARCAEGPRDGEETRDTVDWETWFDLVTAAASYERRVHRTAHNLIHAIDVLCREIPGPWAPSVASGRAALVIGTALDILGHQSEVEQAGWETVQGPPQLGLLPEIMALAYGLRTDALSLVTGMFTELVALRGIPLNVMPPQERPAR
jgi:hypothetical protein